MSNKLNYPASILFSFSTIHRLFCQISSSFSFVFMEQVLSEWKSSRSRTDKEYHDSVDDGLIGHRRGPKLCQASPIRLWSSVVKLCWMYRVSRSWRRITGERRGKKMMKIIIKIRERYLAHIIDIDVTRDRALLTSLLFFSCSRFHFLILPR